MGQISTTVSSKMSFFNYDKANVGNILWSTYPSQAQRAFPYLEVGVHNNPRFDKRDKGGEDAFVISKNLRMIGVCDGVGGWEKHNICSGKFSKFLCKRMGDLYEFDKT